MIIPYYYGENIFENPCPIKVNTVNVVGVMGKGVALEFKKLFPDMFLRYKTRCNRGNFKPGDIWFDSPTGTLCAATKDHWRDPSRIEWVESCIVKIQDFMCSNEYPEIAMTMLGCGNGGLSKSRVLEIMQKHFVSEGITYHLYL